MNELDRPCPTCGAPAGARCRRLDNGQPAKKYHYARETRIAQVPRGFVENRAEADLEMACRTVACPQCDATPGLECSYTERPRTAPDLNYLSYWSHTGRYRAAVGLQLVPPLPSDEPVTIDLVKLYNDLPTTYSERDMRR